MAGNSEDPALAQLLEAGADAGADAEAGTEEHQHELSVEGATQGAGEGAELMDTELQDLQPSLGDEALLVPDR